MDDHAVDDRPAVDDHAADDRLATLHDLAQIDGLVHRYCDAVTRRDLDAIADTWAEHASWDIGRGRTAEGRGQIIELFVRVTSAVNLVVQHVHNGAATVDTATGTGHGRWYIGEQLERASGERTLLYSWYDDTYVREGGTWRFARRTMTFLYHGAPDLSAPFTPHA